MDQGKDQQQDSHDIEPELNGAGDGVPALPNLTPTSDENLLAERVELYKNAMRKHVFEGKPYVPPPPLVSWPSPLEEASGDMENKELDLHNRKQDMYPLHTSLLEPGPSGIDETSQTFLDMLNDESTLSSVDVDPDDSDSIPYKEHKSRLTTVDREAIERSIREAQDLISDLSLNYSSAEPHLAEVKEAISKRDEIISQLISSHQSLQHRLDEKDEELRKTLLMADELTKLKTTIQEFAESAENLRDVRFRNLSFQFNATAESANQTEPKTNADQVSQTSQTVENEKSSPLPNFEHLRDLEDLNLRVADLEKKLEARNNYIEELTVERETERDEFLRGLENADKKFVELKSEKDRLEKMNAQHLTELDDFEERLKDADEVEQQLVTKSKHAEEELKIAVEKIYELREIIRDLEQQIDSASAKAVELKEQNELLTDELNRLERKEKDETLQTSQETITTGVPDEVIEEIQTQISDLTSKLEKKLVEMDSCPWSTRPNSACSGGQYVSSEDVSVREFSLSRTMQPAAPYLIAESLCRLEAHFDSLMRFEELIMKKVKDNEIRYGNAKKRNEELENEKLALQETLKEQILKISDLQSRLDQFRFEPSPNAVTLTGLRARVQLLSEQLEEYKGKLQLKIIENQDIEEKLASAQALLAKYTSQQQLQKLSAKRMESAIIQTEPVIILRQHPNKAKEVSVQTACAGVQTHVPWADSHPLESLEFSTIHGGPQPIHSTPNDPIPDLSRRKKIPNWASNLERESPEVLRYRDAGELQSTPTSSFGKLAETDMARDNAERELSLVVRKNQDLEQKLAFAQELIVKLQQTTKVVKIGATQTERPASRSVSAQADPAPKPMAAEAVAQTTQLDISTTIQKNADLQNELASARLLISKLQSPKNVAITQTDAITMRSTPVQTDAGKPLKRSDSQIQTESAKLTCGHENEIQTTQRKNRDLERKLACAQEAISKLQQQQTKPRKAALTQTSTNVSRTWATQTDPSVEPRKEVLLSSSRVAKSELATRPALSLNFEAHSKHDSSMSNESWYAGDEEMHDVHRRNLGASLELYLRIKSHRKALCWQKRYLTQVVHGYKDVLTDVGVGTRHPDYFKKQLSVVPGAIGVVDRRSPLIRFRIIARVVIATTRMRHMVHRWTKRLRHHSYEGTKENSPPPILPSSKHQQTIPPLKIPTGVSKTELRNVLTQHYERFKSLEDEIAHTMTNRLKRKEHK